MDLYHGTGALPTLFRNQLTGLEPNKTQNTSVINIWGFNRLPNIVGNVLGTSGYHTRYEDSRAPSGTAGAPDTVDLSRWVIPASTRARRLGLRPSRRQARCSAGATTTMRPVRPDGARPRFLPTTAFPARRRCPLRCFFLRDPAGGARCPGRRSGRMSRAATIRPDTFTRFPRACAMKAARRRPDGTLAFDAAQCYPGTPPDTTLPNVSVTTPVQRRDDLRADHRQRDGFRQRGRGRRAVQAGWQRLRTGSHGHAVRGLLEHDRRDQWQPQPLRRGPRRGRKYQDVHGHRRHREQRRGHDRAVRSRESHRHRGVDHPNHADLERVHRQRRGRRLSGLPVPGLRVLADRADCKWNSDQLLGSGADPGDRLHLRRLRLRRRQ